MEQLERIAPGYMRRAITPLFAASAVSQTNKLWINHSVISYRFIGGNISQHIMFVEVLEEIMEMSGLIFAEANPLSTHADIRVGFDSSQGSWSYVGTDARLASDNEPTINLGWDKIATYRHECGHTIGLVHEQASPNAHIDWNKPVVYEEISGAPNYWPRWKIDFNFFAKIDAELIQYTSYDPDSVMIYSIPARFTNNGYSIKGGEDWSVLDRQRISTAYPKRTTPVTTDTDRETIIKECEDAVWSNTPEICIDSEPMEGSFDCEYDEDTYLFEVESAQDIRIKTAGHSDTVMQLFGPDSATRMIAEDDDGMQDYAGNSMIEKHLLPGVYIVQLRHYSNIEGGYTISVEAA